MLWVGIGIWSGLNFCTDMLFHNQSNMLTPGKIRTCTSILYFTQKIFTVKQPHAYLAVWGVCSVRFGPHFN